MTRPLTTSKKIRLRYCWGVGVRDVSLSEEGITKSWDSVIFPEMENFKSSKQFYRMHTSSACPTSRPPIRLDSASGEREPESYADEASSTKRSEIGK